MKKLLLVVLLAIFIASCCSSCTENQRAKQWGGTAKIDLPAGKKLVVVTWKDSDLWYLTRDMRADEKAESYHFSEESSWGAFEGTYIIKETEKPKKSK